MVQWTLDKTLDYNCSSKVSTTKTRAKAKIDAKQRRCNAVMIKIPPRYLLGFKEIPRLDNNSRRALLNVFQHAEASQEIEQIEFLAG